MKITGAGPARTAGKRKNDQEDRILRRYGRFAGLKPGREQTGKCSMKKNLLIAAGSLMVGLGIIGIFLPLLPTTPFLLLAAACYIRSSRRFYEWLVNNRWLGRYIRDYREKRGVPAAAKVFSLSLLWLTIGISAIFVANQLWLRVILLIIAVGVTVHILSLRTLRY